MNKHINIFTWLIICTKAKTFAILIVNATSTSCHKKIKEEIDAFDNTFSASEISVKTYCSRIVVAFKSLKSVLVAHKNFGHSLTETINTLFDVANHKFIFIVVGDNRKQGILCFIGILKLVD